MRRHGVRAVLPRSRLARPISLARSVKSSTVTSFAAMTIDRETNGAQSARYQVALEALAQRLTKVFTDAGYEFISPAMIQPASLFLDVIGESLRARTYVFTDPDGEELCLRPDLTIPTARVFLERNGQPPHAKFCYNGPAFRIQEGKPDPLRPREFRQAGIEYYGAPQLEADLEVLTLTVEAVRRGGVRSFS